VPPPRHHPTVDTLPSRGTHAVKPRLSCRVAWASSCERASRVAVRTLPVPCYVVRRVAAKALTPPAVLEPSPLFLRNLQHNASKQKTDREIERSRDRVITFAHTVKRAQTESRPEGSRSAQKHCSCAGRQAGTPGKLGSQAGTSGRRVGGVNGRDALPLLSLGTRPDDKPPAHKRTKKTTPPR
jgi:hypothetical protein